jgi:aspartyl-tRNA(Asn)/glutamyl-tRNA(Gln) amidotransferase subunit B
MQMGHMRFEPNINLHIRRGEQVFKTPIVEVKNLNSFRALEGAVAYEFDRQYRQWLEDPDYTLQKFGKQNRGFDDQRGITVFQREKEEAHDYRYFPDPDLVGVVVDNAWRDRLRASIPELPLARRRRYMDQYQLSFKEADALTQDLASGDLLDEAVRLGADAKRCTNLLLGRGSAIANERGCSIAQVGVSAGQLAELARMLQAGQINATSAGRVFDLLVAHGGSPANHAQAQGLLAVTDGSALEAWVDQVIAANPEAVAEIRSGGKKQKKAFGFLMGQVMKLSGGAAAPAQVQELFARKLEAGGGLKMS